MAATLPTDESRAMDGSGPDRDPVELLADEFIQRSRRGERPTIAEYAEKHPHLADAIRNVFPALVALEQAGASRNGSESGGSDFPLDAPPPAIGDYRILREIGRGAMGVVYEAEQQSLDRRVALKILPWHATSSSIAVERFRREARAAARLHHTNIVPVFDVGEEGHVCYYAMQYIPGQPLDRVLGELRRSRSRETGVGGRAAGVGGRETGDGRRGTGDDARETTRLARESTVESARRDGSRWLVESSGGHYYRSVAQIGQQVADALAYAHSRGIIHRDIKPSNLLLDAAGVVWVTDFGLAKTDDAAITRTGDLLGTLRYMAPERFEGQCDARADVYSLGATLYELLVLRPAHDGRDSADLIARICHSDPPWPRSIDPKLPRDLELIVLKALDRDRRHRYQSADALAEDLRRFLGDEPILGRRTPLAERFARWARRNRTLAAVTVTIAVLLVAAAVASTIVSASFQSLAVQERAARIETTTRLYQSLVREAEAVRLARREGYRGQVWTLLDRARQLETPAVDRDELRREAVQSLGDFVGHEPVVLAGFPAAARSLAMGDALVAVGLADGTICWHTAGGELIGQQQAHFAPIERLAYLADTQTFYSADSRGIVKAWQRQDDRTWSHETLADVDAPLLALVPVREGQVMAAYRRYPNDTQIVVENLVQRRATTVDPRAEVDAAAIHRGGDLLAVACDSELLVYSTRSGHLIERTTTDLGPLLGLAFSRDGRLLFCGCDQGLVVYDLPELRQQTFMRAGEVPLGAFSPDGTQLAFAGNSRRITLWNVRGNRELAVLTLPGWQEIHSLAFDAGGMLLAAADGSSVRLWNLAASGERTVLAGHAAGVTAVDFSRDAQRLASASKDRTIAVWDAASGGQLGITALPAAAQAIAFDPRGRLVAAGDRSGNLRLYDAQALHELADVANTIGAIHAVRFHPAGGHLAAAGQRGVGLWRIEVDEQRLADDAELSRDDVRVALVRYIAAAEIESIQFSADGTLLAWRDAEQKTHAVEWIEGDAARPIAWPLAAPRALSGGQNLAFAAGGRELLFVDRQGQVLGWNVVTDERTLAIGALRDFPAGLVAASPRGDWLAVARTPLQLGVYSLSTHQPLLALREERAAISAAAFSGDGRYLAVGTQDGGLAIWNLPVVREQLAALALEWPERPAAAIDEAPPPLEALSATIETAPDDVRLLVRRGSVLAERGEVDRALDDFSAALKRDEANAAALLARGGLFARQQRFAEAAADYRRALALAPERFSDWLTAAVLLARAGETKEYREHCTQLLARFAADTDPAALEPAVLACLLMPRERPPRDLPLSRLELSLASANVPPAVRSRAWITLALAAVRAGDPELALSHIRRAQQEPAFSQTPALQSRSFFVQALAEAELGQTHLARASLDAAEAFLRSLPPAHRPEPVAERQVLELLQAEARGRIEG